MGVSFSLEGRGVVRGGLSVEEALPRMPDETLSDGAEDSLFIAFSTSEADYLPPS